MESETIEFIETEPVNEEFVVEEKEHSALVRLHNLTFIIKPNKITKIIFM